MGDTDRALGGTAIKPVGQIYHRHICDTLKKYITWEVLASNQEGDTSNIWETFTEWRWKINFMTQVGWDRTGWEAFKYMLFDPENGTILTRCDTNTSSSKNTKTDTWLLTEIEIVFCICTLYLSLSLSCPSPFPPLFPVSCWSSSSIFAIAIYPPHRQLPTLGPCFCKLQ